MLKKIIFNNLFLIFFGFIISILLLEVIFRLQGFGPWKNFKKDIKEPSINEFHPKLGWKPKKGDYIFPAYSVNGENIRFTILKDGNRLSGELEKKQKNEIILIGGSFTQGWAVDDKHTYAWYLQEKIKNLNVENYGVGGYGTYQSYLLLEEILEKKRKINLIIYGFIDHHEERNTGDVSWLRYLTKFSKRKHLSLPYASLGKNDELIKNSPVKYIKLPLRRYSSFVTKVEKKIMQIKLFFNNKNKVKVTEKIILELKKKSENHGAKFVFVFLLSDEKKISFYSNFLKKNNIRFIDCSYPLSDDLIVKNEGHPNKKLHKMYSNCIYQGLYLN